MFDKITLKNYKTHKDTTLKLKPVTLLIGNNNVGKTNLLAGIQHFATLVKRGSFNKHKQPVVASRDLYPHRYRMAEDGEPMGIAIAWYNPEGKINYELELSENKELPDNAACREKIQIQLENGGECLEISSGYDKATNLVALREKIEKEPSLPEAAKELARIFFGDFANTFSYHFQPYLMRGNGEKFLNGQEREMVEQIADNEEIAPKPPRVFSDLGSTGSNLQKVLLRVRQEEERLYLNFLFKMRLIERNFLGVRPSGEKNSGILCPERSRRRSLRVGAACP